MNKQIEELACQAGLEVREGVDILAGYSIEAFAELIVRECLEVVDVGGEFVSRPKMVERIKEHFGVEE